jgi:hypothetical protein
VTREALIAYYRWRLERAERTLTRYKAELEEAESEAK